MLIVPAGRYFLKVSRIIALVLVLVGLSVVFPDDSTRLRRADAVSIGAPTSVRALAGSQHVAVSWTAPSSDGGSALTDYTIEYSSDNGTNWTTFADGTSTAVSAIITGLTHSTTYIVRVSAVNSTGTSSPSSNSSSVSPGTTLSFQTVTNSMVTLGSLATRSACAPLTKQGVGPAKLATELARRVTITLVY